MNRFLPASPCLEQLRKQAKEILRTHQAGDAAVCQTLRWIDRFLGASDQEILGARVRLQEAQTALAMDYGFTGWDALKRRVCEAHEEGSVSDIEVPQEVVAQWQMAVDILARSLSVPAALVMRIRHEDLEVFISSQSDGNPYRVGAREARVGSGLYCQTVIETRDKLRVPHAQSDDQWARNPDVALNMIAYLGLPIMAPNGEVFGTLCLLDTRRRDFDGEAEPLLQCMRDLIEGNLTQLHMIDSLMRRNEQLTEALVELRSLRSLVPICSFCKNVRLNDQWVPVETYLISRAKVRVSHGVCPTCVQRHYPDD